MQKKKKDACLTVKFEWNYFSGGGQREIISNERNGSLCVDINFISCPTSECVCVKVNFKFWFYSNSWLANLNSLSNGNNMDEYKWFLQKTHELEIQMDRLDHEISPMKSHMVPESKQLLYTLHMWFLGKEMFSFPRIFLKCCCLWWWWWWWGEAHIAPRGYHPNWDDGYMRRCRCVRLATLRKLPVKPNPRKQSRVVATRGWEREGVQAVWRGTG